MVEKDEFSNGKLTFEQYHMRSRVTHTKAR